MSKNFNLNHCLDLCSIQFCTLIVDNVANFNREEVVQIVVLTCGDQRRLRIATQRKRLIKTRHIKIYRK